MITDSSNCPPLNVAKIRYDAEELLLLKQANQHSPTTQDIQRLNHELEIHQIELEMQNDELSLEHEKSERLRNMYTELYDLAPVAYFTFDVNGIILEVNHSCADLLDVKKQLLVNRSFTDFILDSDEKEIFLNHLEMVAKRKVILRCSIKLTRKDGVSLHTQFQSVAVSSDNRDRHILTSIVDVTVRKQFENDLQNAHDHLEGIIQERTNELREELEQRKRGEESLKTKNAEIKQLKNRLQLENVYLQREVSQQFNFGEIIGQSEAINKVFIQIDQVGPMNATVLLLGETGTGKGVVARAIHKCSGRSNRSLTTVNCSTLPATLVESELFGRERGAFTGSDTRQIGRFELADGGTIFLDEIGELPLELQSKLLRVIQEGEFERLGNPRTIKTDVRIIAASNRNLTEDVSKGTFREDLFYRLNVFPITLPPLRQRKDDIPLLVNHFISKFNRKIGKKIESISKDILNKLQLYQWPGNVRELESIIERAVIISQGTSLQVLDRLEAQIKAEEPTDQNIKTLDEMEHDYILRILQKNFWRIEGKNGAALLLGLNASTLRARMRKYGIVRR